VVRGGAHDADPEIEEVIGRTDRFELVRKLGVGTNDIAVAVGAQPGTVNAWASWSAVRFSETAIETGWMSSLARGPTTTPPTTMPVPGRQKSFTNPSRTPCIFARALPESGSITVSTWISPASTALWVHPTVAISGAVNTFAETVLRSSGATASPRKCHMAMRPCMAATEASMNTPVQSPAA